MGEYVHKVIWEPTVQPGDVRVNTTIRDAGGRTLATSYVWMSPAEALLVATLEGITLMLKEPPEGAKIFKQKYNEEKDLEKPWIKK